MRSCFVALPLVLTSTFSFSQITFGPVSAVSYSMSTGGFLSVDYGWNYGYRVEGFMNAPIGNKWFIHSAFAINNKGYGYDSIGRYSGAFDTSFHGRHRFTYLEIPLCIGRSWKSGWHTEGGMFAGYQIMQSWKEYAFIQDPNGSGAEYAQLFKSSKEITGNRFQTGLVASVGYVKDGFDLSLSSQYHLTPFMTRDVPNFKSQHHFQVSLGLAYHFKLPGKVKVKG